jgi:transcriptional regulator with XRE-family HTH domain
LGYNKAKEVTSLENHIGKRILNLLEEKNITQRDLAKMLGITEVSVSRYIKGKHIPHSDILSKLAETLGTTTDYLLGNEVVDRTDGDLPPIKKLVHSFENLSEEEQREAAKEILNRVLGDKKK